MQVRDGPGGMVGERSVRRPVVLGSEPADETTLQLQAEENVSARQLAYRALVHMYYFVYNIML